VSRGRLENLSNSIYCVASKQKNQKRNAERKMDSISYCLKKTRKEKWTDDDKKRGRSEASNANIWSGMPIRRFLSMHDKGKPESFYISSCAGLRTFWMLLKFLQFLVLTICNSIYENVFNWSSNLAFCLDGLGLCCLVACPTPEARPYLTCRIDRVRSK